MGNAMSMPCLSGCALTDICEQTSVTPCSFSSLVGGVAVVRGETAICRGGGSMASPLAPKSGLGSKDAVLMAGITDYGRSKPNAANR